MGRKKIDIRDRFWIHVTILGEDDCWNWNGSKDKDGYGNVWKNDISLKAHRVSFFLANGYLPDNLVLHSCDNRACVNPKHLHSGSQSQNIKECLDRGRWRGFPNGSVGKNNGHSKVTEDDVVRIRQIYSEGKLTMKQIGSMFGLSQSGVFNVIRRRWKHVPEAIVRWE